MASAALRLRVAAPSAPVTRTRRASHLYRRNVRQTTAESSSSSSSVAADAKKDKTFKFREYEVSYCSGQERSPQSPFVFVHGFGGGKWQYFNVIEELDRRGLWRANGGRAWYSIDLLGFGNSSKPRLSYSPRLWAEQIEAIDEFVCQTERESAVNEEADKIILVGNSIGSLTSMTAAIECPDKVRALVLLNMVGGMNLRGVARDDYRLLLLLPFFQTAITLLKLFPSFADKVFRDFASKENVRRLLEEQVYTKPSKTIDEAVDFIVKPSQDEGALDVFLSVIGDDPGTGPFDLLANLMDAGSAAELKKRVSQRDLEGLKSKIPILVLWGDSDQWAPLDGPVGDLFSCWGPGSNITFQKLVQTGHCPQDDSPEDVAKYIDEWINKNAL